MLNHYLIVLPNLIRNVVTTGINSKLIAHPWHNLNNLHNWFINLLTPPVGFTPHDLTINLHLGRLTLPIIIEVKHKINYYLFIMYEEYFLMMGNCSKSLLDNLIREITWTTYNYITLLFYPKIYWTNLHM